MRGIGKVIVVGLILAIAAFFFVYTRAIKPKVFVPSVAAPQALTVGPWQSTALDPYIKKFLRPDGSFNFAAAKMDVEADAELDGYLAACALASPESAPERFTDPTVALAYWLRAHDAMSIKTVLKSWPINSLLDIPASYSVVEGAGFFRGVSFNLGGKGTTLHGLVTQALPRATKDPRVILALGGPARFVLPYAATIPTGPSQDAWLNDRVTRFFTEDERLVIRDQDIGIASWVYWREEWFIGVAPVQTDESNDRLVAALTPFVPLAKQAAFKPAAGRTYRRLPPDFRIR